MTDSERFKATISGQRPERILYTAGFTPDLHRRLVEHAGTEDLTGHYGLFAPAHVGLRPPPGYAKPEYSVYYAKDDLPEGTTLNDDGVAMRPAHFYHFWGYLSPLRNATSIKQIEDYPFSDRSDWLDEHMAGEVAAARAKGRVVTYSIGHMYETSWQIRGYEQFLIDMVERPSWAEAMLDKLFRRNMNMARAAAKAGVDMIHCGDDVANQKAMMFSVPMWRHFMLSRWKQVWTLLRQARPDIQIHYHSDGNISAVIPELRAAGVTILNPIQPECMDPVALRRQYPDLNFDGTIGTQSTMPFGKPDDVRKAVKRMVEQVGGNGRLFLAPTHVLEPDVSIANFEAYVQAARES